MAEELIGEPAFDHRRFRIVGWPRRSTRSSLARQRLGDIALAGEAELHEQRFKPIGIAALQTQHAVEGRLVELAAGDETGRDLPLDLFTLEFNDHGLPCARRRS